VAGGGVPSIAAGASPLSGHGHVGSVVLGREDLLRVRASLGRISDEMHLILGVLDQHLDSAQDPAMPSSMGRELDIDTSVAKGAEQEDFVPLPREELPVATPTPEARSRVLAAWVWSAAECFFWAGVCVLDVAIIIGMQLFLESISRKRGGSSIISKRSAATAIATKAAGGAPGAPIPAPSATPARSSSQRLSVLSQEELLAACLTEHWGKLAIGVGIMVACRLPQRLLNSNGFFCQMMLNLTVMLRCMSLVMLLIREDMALPPATQRSAR